MEYPTLPGYATKQTSDSASDKYELSFPYLDGKELSVTFSPLHGKGKGSHNYFFKSRGGNKMLHKDRIIQHKKVKFTYQKLQDKTEEYFDDLWDNNRERLSGISSSAAGLLNSKKMLETVKIKLFGFNLKFASNLIREILDEDCGFPLRGHTSCSLVSSRTGSCPVESTLLRALFSSKTMTGTIFHKES